VSFRVGELAVGRPPTEDEQRLNLSEHVFGSPAARSREDVEIDRKVQAGDPVVVSRYQLGDRTHYVIRPADAAAHESFDVRRLPRFLFLGAGLMTLGVLLVLWWRVRDLPSRAMTLLRSLTGIRYVPEGLVTVPGDGPVALLIESAPPSAVRAIRAAVDRYVSVFEPKTADPALVAEAEAVLRRGDVVAVLMEAPAGQAFAAALHALKIPVRVDGRLLVFGELLPT
jgi:hypothetical protein